MVIAVVCGYSVQQIVTHANAKEKSYGITRTVWVTRASVDAGNDIKASDVTRKKIPRALLPDAPVAPFVVGHAVLVDFAKGEVILASRIAPTGLHGAAALLPLGKRAVGIQPGPGSPPLHIGDTVDVLASFEHAGSDAQTNVPTVAVAQRAQVLDVRDNAVTIAVLPDEAPKVAFRATNGALSLILDNG